MPQGQTAETLGAVERVSKSRIYTAVPAESGELRAARSAWAPLESEVAQYCQNEPGAGSCNLDSNGGGGFGSKMLSFAPGTDPCVMMTVHDRFKVADTFMPMETVRYELHVVETPTLWGPSKIAAQIPLGEDRPSASQVLRAAYGTQAAKYDDSAPGGSRLLEQAKNAYIKAARIVPRRERKSRKVALAARFDRQLDSLDRELARLGRESR